MQDSVAAATSVGGVLWADCPDSGLQWLEQQADFRSDSAHVVRTYVAQLVRCGTLSLGQQAAIRIPTYVAKALADQGVDTAAASAVWQQFLEDRNLKMSRSGRCRSEVQRQARFMIWWKEKQLAAASMQGEAA